MVTSKIDKNEFYSRQKILKEIGEEGQSRLDKSSVLIVGAGGLGNPLAVYLAASGVGNIGICDFDKIEISNLHRQVLFTPRDVGLYKAEVLRDRISLQNPLIKASAITERITVDNGEEMLSAFDIVIDCSDNFETKFLLHDLSFALGRDLLQSSIYQYEGELQVFKYSNKSIKNEGCLRCLWPVAPKKNCVANCAMAGVIGAVAGTFGSLLAMETILSILGLGGLKHRETLMFDLLSLSSYKVSWPKAQECPLCSHDLSVAEVKSNLVVKADGLEVDGLEGLGDFVLIDVREDQEVKLNKVDGAIFMPMSLFDEEVFVKTYDSSKKVVLLCASGARSYRLVSKLRDLGLSHVFSLSGGLTSLK